MVRGTRVENNEEEIARAEIPVNKARLVHRLQRFRALSDVRETRPGEVILFNHENVVETGPFQVFHNEVLLVARRKSFFKGVDDIGMLELDCNLSFARLAHAFHIPEAFVDLTRLLLIENLETDYLVRLLVARHIEFRHCAGNCRLQQGKTFLIVEFLFAEYLF